MKERHRTFLDLSIRSAITRSSTGNMARKTTQKTTKKAAKVEDSEVEKGNESALLHSSGIASQERRDGQDPDNPVRIYADGA